MNMTMLLIVIAIVVPGYFMVSRLSRNLYSYNAKMDEETEDFYGFDGSKEPGEENENEDNPEIQDEEITDENEPGIPNEETINENQNETFKKDSKIQEIP